MLRNTRILLLSLGGAISIVIVKYILHLFNFEFIEQSSLHNGVISSTTFVIGFLLSATIADYKESERIPSDVAANIEDLYDDAAAIHSNYPVFDLAAFRSQLEKIASEFGKDLRKRSYNTSDEIRSLSVYFAAMETGKVPPNFIVKLKQQSTQLLRSRHRLNYIQRIKFIPSASILVKSIVVITLALLLFTNVDPYYGGLAIVGIISFIFIYILLLLNVIGTPFHAEGKTRDDVSLFLISDAANYLRSKK